VQYELQRSEAGAGFGPHTRQTMGLQRYRQNRRKETQTIIREKNQKEINIRIYPYE
jgi:hypothetical protein